MIVRLHPEASREIEAAAMRYESSSGGLGDEFLTEVSRGLAAVAESPSTWSRHPRMRRVRRFTLSRFPYSVLYLVARDEIRVVAVAHAARRPGYWRSRRFDA